MRLELDHIAVGARTLAEGVAHVEAALGVRIPPGGAHPLMGTHNHLLAVGSRGTPQSCFLEVIAPDPAAPPPARRRWFGLDAPPTSPRLLTWIARSADLATVDIARSFRLLQPAVVPVIEVTRGDLRWRIGVPEDGSLPLDGAFPTLIEWPRGVRPSDSMHDAGCRLVSLEIAHPRGAEIAAALAPYLDDPRVAIVEKAEPRLAATFDTALGLRRLV